MNNIKIEASEFISSVFTLKLTAPVRRFDIRNVTKPTYFESIITANENMNLSFIKTS